MAYKLVCFDVEGTLVEGETGVYWEVLHTILEGEAGDRKQAERAAAFKAGQLGYKEWVDLDLGDLQKEGFTRDDLIRVAKTRRLMPGARETVLEFKRRGYRLAVVSGSLNILIETLFPDHPFSDVMTNQVSFGPDGRIAAWKDTVYDQGSKHEALRLICEREGIPLSETVFVGDGENDIDILKAAGLGIAFCPKSKRVEEAADVVIRKCDVREILKHVE